MQQLFNVLQPQYFERFRCIGAECEDTCCDGWGILVDRQTYDKYQNVQAPNPGQTALRDLVEINPASCSSSDFARIRLAGTRCPALSEGLCSIQQGLGESWLSDKCSSYPRVLTRLQGKIERSLHLSCPEAARLVLTDPEAMLFQESTVDEPPHRPGAVSSIDVGFSDEMHSSRALIVKIVKERNRPLPARLESLGRAVNTFAGLDPKEAPAILQDHLQQLQRGASNQAPSDQAPADGAARAAMQFETVLEMVVARIGAGYTSPRFLECYGEFMSGLGWTGESTMDELASRYRFLVQNRYMPFELRCPYLFENYLINHVFRTFFPYGRRSPDQKVLIDSSEKSIRDAFALMVTYYAIVRTILAGMSGLRGSDLTVDRAVKLVQSCARVFEHSSSAAADLLDFLARQPGDLIGNIAILVAD